MRRHGVYVVNYQWLLRIPQYIRGGCRGCDSPQKHLSPPCPGMDSTRNGPIATKKNHCISANIVVTTRYCHGFEIVSSRGNNPHGIRLLLQF